MKKEQIYVTIDDEEKRLRAIEILEKAGEEICQGSNFFRPYLHEMQICFDSELDEWGEYQWKDKAQISLDRLESFMLPNYQVKDVILSLDELKQQAEKLGYDLVEKPYEPKVGDFGIFWDDKEENFISGFMTEIHKRSTTYKVNNYNWWLNFRKLTDEEKQKIQESW